LAQIHSSFPPYLVIVPLSILFEREGSREIPFIHFQIVFNDDSIIDVVRNLVDSQKKKTRAKITVLLSSNNSEVFSLDLTMPNNPDEVSFSLEILNEIRGLHQVDFNLWRYLPTDEHLSLGEVLDRFEDVLSPRVKLREEPQWLEDFKYNIQVRLIESQRLLNVISNPSRIYTGTASMLNTVSAYSNEIAQIMRNKFTEYGAISQSLDRTFPNRLVQRQSSPNLTDEQLRDRLERLESTRSRLIEVGLLDKAENSDFPIYHLANSMNWFCFTNFYSKSNLNLLS
jgi:hypothetical protein